MGTCKYYKTKTVSEPWFKITGEPEYRPTEIGICTRDKCNKAYCHGNKARCDFDEKDGKWR